jgi:hypothetical protein
MSNSLLTNSVITKECLRELKNQLGLASHVNRGYDEQFAVKGAKIGDTINLRKPARYSVTSGAALEIQDSQDQSVALQLDSQKHVGMAFSSKDRTLSIDEFKDRYIKPAMTALANDIDYSGYSSMYKAVYSSVGVPSASAFPSTLKGFTQAVARMQLLGCPVDEYTAIVDPNVQASLVEGLKGLFQSSEQIKRQYEKGLMGMAAGCKFVSSPNVVKHTIGDHEGTPAIDTTVTTNGTATLHLDGTLGTVTGWAKAGDVIEIASVYSVNPVTKQSTGNLMQFVVTADTNSSANEIAALPISPAIYLSGPYQNVNRAPTDGDVVTIFGHATSYANLVVPQNLVFHKDAFVLGMADLALPGAGAKGERASDPDAGLSIRFVEQYDINNDRNIARLDVLYGWKCVYPELACRVVGQPA